jgi:hypothetical protein
MMGITIRYAGRANSEEDIAAVFNETIVIAREFGWRCRIPDPESIREEGLSFLPHEDCEPLHIWFTKTRRFSDFCKTQFAGPEVHSQVLTFFKKISPRFSKLIIYDEAEEFTENGKTMTLEDAFHIALQYIEEGLVEHPGSQMKVRLPSGRIADLVG